MNTIYIVGPQQPSSFVGLVEYPKSSASSVKIASANQPRVSYDSVPDYVSNQYQRPVVL